MKKIIFLLIVLLGFTSSSTFAQNQQQQISSIAHAEKMVNTYFRSSIYSDRLLKVYDTKPLEFLMRNRKYIYAVSNDIINKSVTDGFDFSETGDVVFNYLNSIYQIGELNLRENFVEQIGTPFVQTRAAGDPCTNMDFEDGTLNGWELYDGYVNSSPSQMVSATQVFGQNAQHTLMSPGPDPVVGIPMVNPNGGAWSLRLGDGTGTGGLAASIKQTFLVDSNNAVFTYSYAVVLEDPSGHSYGEKPFFKVNMYDANGNQISCGEYEVVANSGLDASWTNYGAGWYKNWTTVFAPLDGYIGQNVTIEFITGDCSQGGHYGYAYVDAECNPLQIIPPGTVICDNQPVTLSAPPGAASYSWNTGATTQSITTNQVGNYSVQVAPVTGAQCSITINATINGVGGAPTADFTIAPTSICAGETVNVTDQSTATNNATIDQYQWDFGDGSATVTGVTTTVHQYDSSGTFDVQLIAGVQTCYDTLVQQVTVNPAPTADFSSSFECEGTVTHFTDLSTSSSGAITNWQWDFDSNSTIDNTTQSPTNGYANAGTYNATLIVTASGGCTDTVTHPVTVNPVPVAEFSWVDVCPGQANSFTDQSTILTGNITNWQWDMGDGQGTSALQSPTYTYATAGTYNVQLTVTSDSGCIDNIIHTVSQYPNPTANFSLQDVCTGETVILTDASSGNGGTINTWGWDIQDDGIVDYSVQNTSFTYASPGNYTVELYVETMDGCSDSTTQSITVFTGPVVDYTFASVCEGNSISFTDVSTSTSGSVSGWNWDFGNGATSTSQNPTQLFSSEGVYNVALEVTTTDGCVASTSQMVDVWPNPDPNFVVSPVCLGNTTSFVDISNVSNQFTSNTVTQWSWDFGDGQGTSTLQMPSYTYGLEGTYNVQLTATTNNGCVDSITIPVDVFPKPGISVTSSPTAGCATWCVDFNAGSSYITSGTIDQYIWNFGDSDASPDVAPTHCYANESQDVYQFTVSLTLISDEGCQSDTVFPNMVTVYPNPIAEFSADPQPTDIFNTEINFTDESTGNNSYTWNFAGLGSSTLQNPTFTFPDNDAGTYNVCQLVVNEYGCRDSICHDVVIDGVFTFYVPNTFTPDGDGINEFFKPVFQGEDPLHYEFMVFDRWGLLIFKTDNVSKSWDGTYKGTPVQQDTYVWKVIVTDRYKHEKHDYLGHVNVLR